MVDVALPPIARPIRWPTGPLIRNAISPGWTHARRPGSLIFISMTSVAQPSRCLQRPVARCRRSFQSPDTPCARHPRQISCKNGQARSERHRQVRERYGNRICKTPCKMKRPKSAKCWRARRDSVRLECFPSDATQPECNGARGLTPLLGRRCRLPLALLPKPGKPLLESRDVRQAFRFRAQFARRLVRGTLFSGHSILHKSRIDLSFF
jgi:hypothetical protein